jgi:hypothetical protein
MATSQRRQTDEQTRKPLVWLHGEVKTPPFTADGRQEAGMLLRFLQEGETPGMPQSDGLKSPHDRLPFRGCFHSAEASAAFFLPILR